MKPRIPPFALILDDLIRHGNVGQARRDLRKLAQQPIRRAFVADVAALARRTQLPQLSLNLLYPIVRPARPTAHPATEREKGEYAYALIRIGAIEEGEALLREIDSDSYPEALLFRAGALVSQWRYDESIPLLKAYVASPAVDSYQKLVGKVNLAAAALNSARHDEAAALLRELLEETGKRKLYLLHGNALELSAQSAVIEGRWTEAERLLQTAQNALGFAGGLDAMFVRKWIVLMALRKDPGNRKNLSRLKELRREAEKIRHWETVRDCDRFEAITRQDLKLAIHLYFGTPYGAFRAGLLRNLACPMELPADFTWRLGTTGKPDTRLELLTGRESRTGRVLKPGNAPHRLLTALTVDFYRPARLASLYSRIFPGEVFNPNSSPVRVHFALFRLREWLHRNKVPIIVEETDGAYRLTASAPCALIISRQEATVNSPSLHVQRLRREWPERSFVLRDALKVLGISRTSGQRVLEHARNEGFLVQEGRGRSTRYRFKGKGSG